MPELLILGFFKKSHRTKNSFDQEHDEERDHTANCVNERCKQSWVVFHLYLI